MAIRVSFLREIWRCGILWHGTSELSAKVFSVKSYFSAIRESFLPRKFPAIPYASANSRQLNTEGGRHPASRLTQIADERRDERRRQRQTSKARKVEKAEERDRSRRSAQTATEWKRCEPVSVNAWQLKLLLIKTPDCNKLKGYQLRVPLHERDIRLQQIVPVSVKEWQLKLPLNSTCQCEC